MARFEVGWAELAHAGTKPVDAHGSGAIAINQYAGGTPCGKYGNSGFSRSRCKETECCEDNQR